MAFVKLICKANNLRNLTKALEKEKRDSIQLERDEEVKLTLRQKYQHFWIDLHRNFVRVLKKCFCPKRGSCLNKTFYNLGHDGSWENYIMKSFVGFFCGFILTYFLFLFCVITLRINFTAATILCIVLGCTLTIGLAFSEAVRCVTLLTLPQFFSKKGRKALIAYAFILTLSGPGQNLINNMGILNESMACGQELLKQAVRQIIDVIKKPFIAIRDALKAVVKTVKFVIKKIKEILIAIKRIIMAIVRVIKAAFLFLGKILNICNKELGTPYDRCIKVFEDAVLDCNAKLGPWFSWVCSINHLVKGVCFLVKPFDLVCMVVDFISNSVIGTIIKKIKQFVRHVKTMFYVKIKFNHSFKYNQTASKTMKEVAHEMVAEIRERTKTIVMIFNFLTTASTFFFLYMIIQVIYYRFRFLTSERFDNLYITKDFRLIDIRRAGLGKETVLPLSDKERNIYIVVKSMKLVKTEKKSLKKALSKLFVITIKIGTFLATDYCLFWIMNMINYYGRFQSKVTAPNVPTLNIQGNGLLADLLKSIVSAFQPLGITLEIDTIPCLPTPIPPDYDTYIQIGFILLLSWILAISEPYGLRLRHKVMVYYYPVRGKQRAIWLYNHIIRNRSSFLKLARRQLRRKLLGTKNIEKVTCKEYLRANLKSPIFGFCLGPDKQDACLLCAEVIRESDTKKFYRCKTPQCPGIYCEECFRDLKNLCTVCMSPIDYGDISDIDEEVDSSEQDEVTGAKRKRRRKRKCKCCSCLKPRDVEYYSTDDDYGDDNVLIKDEEYGGKSFDSDYNTGESTDYSTSYQFDPKQPAEPIGPRISRSKDIEKQHIPDYASMETFRDDYLKGHVNIDVTPKEIQDQISERLSGKSSSQTDTDKKLSPKEEKTVKKPENDQLPQKEKSGIFTKILPKFLTKLKPILHKDGAHDILRPDYPESDDTSSEDNKYLTMISEVKSNASDIKHHYVQSTKDLTSSTTDSSSTETDTTEILIKAAKRFKDYSSETYISETLMKSAKRFKDYSSESTDEDVTKPLIKTKKPRQEQKLYFMANNKGKTGFSKSKTNIRKKSMEPEKQHLLSGSETSTESTDSSIKRGKCNVSTSTNTATSETTNQTTSYPSSKNVHDSTESMSLKNGDLLDLSSNTSRIKEDVQTQTDLTEPKKQHLLSGIESSTESTDSSIKRSKLNESTSTNTATSETTNQTSSYPSSNNIHNSTESTSLKNGDQSDLSNSTSRINKQVRVPPLDLSFLDDVPLELKKSKCPCYLKSCKHDRFKYIKYNIETETSSSKSSSSTSSSSRVSNRQEETSSSSQNKSTPSLQEKRKKVKSEEMFDPSFINEPLDTHLIEKTQQKKIHDYYKTVNMLSDKPIKKRVSNFVNYLKNKFSRKCKHSNRSYEKSIELNFYDKEPQEQQVSSANTSPTYPFETSQRLNPEEPKEFSTNLEQDAQFNDNKDLLNETSFDFGTNPIGESTRNSESDFKKKTSLRGSHSYSFDFNDLTPTQENNNQMITRSLTRSEKLPTPRNYSRVPPEKPLDDHDQFIPNPCDLDSENSSILSDSYCEKILGYPLRTRDTGPYLFSGYDSSDTPFGRHSPASTTGLSNSDIIALDGDDSKTKLAKDSDKLEPEQLGDQERLSKTSLRKASKKKSNNELRKRSINFVKKPAKGKDSGEVDLESGQSSDDIYQSPSQLSRGSKKKGFKLFGKGKDSSKVSLDIQQSENESNTLPLGDNEGKDSSKIDADLEQSGDNESIIDASIKDSKEDDLDSDHLKDGLGSSPSQEMFQPKDEEGSIDNGHKDASTEFGKEKGSGEDDSDLQQSGNENQPPPSPETSNKKVGEGSNDSDSQNKSKELGTVRDSDKIKPGLDLENKTGSEGDTNLESSDGGQNKHPKKIGKHSEKPSKKSKAKEKGFHASGEPIVKSRKYLLYLQALENKKKKPDKKPVEKSKKHDGTKDSKESPQTKKDDEGIDRLDTEKDFDKSKDNKVDTRGDSKRHQPRLRQSSDANQFEDGNYQKGEYIKDDEKNSKKIKPDSQDAANVDRESPQRRSQMLGRKRDSQIYKPGFEQLADDGYQSPTKDQASKRRESKARNRDLQENPQVLDRKRDSQIYNPELEQSADDGYKSPTKDSASKRRESKASHKDLQENPQKLGSAKISDKPSSDLGQSEFNEFMLPGRFGSAIPQNRSSDKDKLEITQKGDLDRDPNKISREPETTADDYPLDHVAKDSSESEILESKILGDSLKSQKNSEDIVAGSPPRRNKNSLLDSEGPLEEIKTDSGQSTGSKRSDKDLRHGLHKLDKTKGSDSHKTDTRKHSEKLTPDVEQLPSDHLSPDLSKRSTSRSHHARDLDKKPTSRKKKDGMLQRKLTKNLLKMVSTKEFKTLTPEKSERDNYSSDDLRRKGDHPKDDDLSNKSKKRSKHLRPGQSTDDYYQSPHSKRQKKSIDDKPDLGPSTDDTYRSLSQFILSDTYKPDKKPSTDKGNLSKSASSKRRANNLIESKPRSGPSDSADKDHRSPRHLKGSTVAETDSNKYKLDSNKSIDQPILTPYYLNQLFHFLKNKLSRKSKAVNQESTQSTDDEEPQRDITDSTTYPLGDIPEASSEPEDSDTYRFRAKLQAAVRKYSQIDSSEVGSSTEEEKIEQTVKEACKKLLELSSYIDDKCEMPLSRHCPEWDSCSCYCGDNSEAKDDHLITDEGLSRNSSAYIKCNSYDESSGNEQIVNYETGAFTFPCNNITPKDSYSNSVKDVCKNRSPNTLRNQDVHNSPQKSMPPCTYQNNKPNPCMDQYYCTCNYSSSGSNCDEYCCSCSDEYSEVNFFDLPYQNNTEYMELLQELECTLVNRNKERVQRTMREFEANSKLNRNIEKPIYDEDDSSSEPILRKMTKITSNRNMCEPGCKCCNKLNNSPISNRSSMRSRKELPKTYVESIVRNMDPNPQEQLQKYPKFKSVVSTTRWQLDQKSGEWIKMSDQGDSGFIQNNRAGSCKNICCGCEICSNQRLYRGYNNKSKPCKCCYCTNRRPRK